MKRLFCALFFVCVLTSSVFANLPKLNDLNSVKQDYLSKKMEGLSAQLDKILTELGNGGSEDGVLNERKEVALKQLANTKNNILSNVKAEDERVSLQKFDEHLKNQANIIPVNLEIQKTGWSDKIYNITLRFLSPTAIFAVDAVIIIRSVERIILSGEPLRIVEAGTNFYWWHTVGSIVPVVLYYLPWLIRPFCGV